MGLALTALLFSIEIDNPGLGCIITSGMAVKKVKIYTVSQVNTLIQVALEQNLPSRMVVGGEISDWKQHYSGHCYFSLKDPNGILPCVMWASKFKKVKFSPENGMAVLATGHVDIYPPQGKYQFYVDRLEPGGVGALQLAFEQMVKRLETEGLFADEHKKAIPRWPIRIGIITSESGAALMDIADSVYNRWPCSKLFLYPAAVQGEGAAEQIAAAIRNVNRRNKKLEVDVLIVGRGGGSVEDLWAVNERLAQSAKDLFQQLRERLVRAYELIRQIEPHRVLGQKRDELNELANAAKSAMKNVFVKKKLQLTAVKNRLEALNPKSVLSRGYSITTNKKTGKVVTAAADVAITDVLITELAHRNLIESEVKSRTLNAELKTRKRKNGRRKKTK